MELPRTLIIGIDGATFDLVKPWAEAGLLPTFAHLLKHGAHATLNSFPHLLSAPAWTNLVTGYNPGQHNIYNFLNMGRTNSWHPTTARDRLKPTFWQLLADAGQRVGVMNVPITFPADDTNAFMLSGMDAPDTEIRGFARPAGLVQELRAAGIDYILDVPNVGQMVQSGVKTLPPVIRDMTVTRTRAFLHLLEKYPCDAAMVVYVAGDRLSHYFWNESPPLPDAPEWKPLRDLFQLFDAQLAELLAHASSDTTVFIVSDHGFGPVKLAKYGLNDLLQRLGYQTAGKPHSGNRVLRDLLHVGRRIVPLGWQGRLAMMFPRAHAQAARADKLGKFQVSKTKAYAMFWGGVRLNTVEHSPDGIVTDAEYDALWNELADVLYSLYNPETGAPLVADIYHAGDYFRGPWTRDATDLLAVWDNRNVGHALGYRGKGQNIVLHPSHPRANWRGVHEAEGIFIAYGKGVREGVAHPPITHFELAPTVLWMHDQPLSDDLDGHPLVDWFEPSFSANHSVTPRAASAYVPGADILNDAENERVEHRLRQMGYIE